MHVTEYHHVPGRLRARVPRLKGNHHAAACLAGKLQAVAGVESVSASTVTGSVIIRYDHNTVSNEALWAALPPRTGQEENASALGNMVAAAADTAAKALLNAALEQLISRSAVAIIGALV